MKMQKSSMISVIALVMCGNLMAETATFDKHIKGWQKSTRRGSQPTFEYAANEGHASPGSLMIQEKGTGSLAVFKFFTAPDSPKVKASVWCKIAEVKAGAKVEVQMKWKDAEGKWVAENIVKVPIDVAKTGSWQQVTLEGAKPQAAKSIAIMFYLASAAGSTLYFDDLEINGL